VQAKFQERQDVYAPMKAYQLRQKLGERQLTHQV
jgi:hypothetical protein